MTTLPTSPPPPKGSRTVRRTVILWLISGAFMFGWPWAQIVARALHVVGPLSFVTFIASLIWIFITLSWITLSIRWLLRKLFWRVGRRLLLSYILIGLLPFILMTVLILAVVYMIAGVMSHAALRGERQATLGQMESQALEYGLTGKKPSDALKSLEIYDTANGTADKLPEWLRKTSFSGLVLRDRKPILVASRQFADAAGGPPRTVIFAQPIDAAWARQLEEKGGMIISTAEEKKKDDEGSSKKRQRRGSTRVNVDRDNDEEDVVLQSDGDFDEFMRRGFAANRVIWADFVSPTEWDNGTTNRHKQLFTLLSNPISNLFQFYFGSSSNDYIRILAQVILALVIALFIIYMFAAAFAAVLIFSISRAVNRIEKGTKAVERGDFSYRINMKPHNQLGEMALSFDRMTESIASLLTTVAEKERLQSEIEIAATIQRNLLPKEGPQFRGVSFSAHFEPTASIGGDYYDVFNLDKSRLAVAIGDVSGHGLSTGLVMAMVKAAITTLVEEGADESSLFRRLNELVFRSTERRAFMTLAFTIFDLEHGTIRHTNAGHLYPYLLRKDTAPISIESPSLPLGVRHELITRTAELDLQEGDAIVYLSDGIIEAQDEEGDPLGFDQLEALLAQQTDRSPSMIRDSILHAVARHSGSRPADDDRTVMVLRFDNFRTALNAEPVLEEPVEVAG